MSTKSTCDACWAFEVRGYDSCAGDIYPVDEWDCGNGDWAYIFSCEAHRAMYGRATLQVPPDDPML